LIGEGTNERVALAAVTVFRPSDECGHSAMARASPPHNLSGATSLCFATCEARGIIGNRVCHRPLRFPIGGCRPHLRGVTYMNKVTRQHGPWTATGTISTRLPQAPPYISYATAKCDRPKERVGCAFLFGHASRWRRVRTVQGLRCSHRRPFCFPNVIERGKFRWITTRR
jgi:hypothetical protein